MLTVILGTQHRELSHRTGVVVIDRESEAWQKRNYDASAPWCLFLMGPNDPIDKGIADVVLYGDVIDNGARVIGIQ